MNHLNGPGNHNQLMPTSWQKARSNSYLKTSSINWLSGSFDLIFETTMRNSLKERDAFWRSRETSLKRWWVWKYCLEGFGIEGLFNYTCANEVFIPRHLNAIWISLRLIMPSLSLSYISNKFSRSSKSSSFMFRLSLRVDNCQLVICFVIKCT